MIQIDHIDWDELEQAFENSDFSEYYYLDTVTGDLIYLHDDLSAEEIFEYASQYLDSEIKQDEYDDEEPMGIFDLDRFIYIEPRPSYESYNIMKDFIVGLSEGRLKELLEIALNGSGAFRRFKDVLLDFPVKQVKWFDFNSMILQEKIKDWIEKNNIKLGD